MKPICVKCCRFFRIKKAGYYFTEAMPTGEPLPQPGTATPHKWKPYKIWSGDRWECEGCGANIVSGVAMHPISEHYQQDFASYMEKLKADQLQVNDC